MTAPADLPERTALYRFYDADDRLLYVGISRRPDTRWAEHRHPLHSPWSKFVASRTLSWFASRALAEAAEVAAIKEEKPRFNGSHNFVKAAFTPEVWAEPITGERKREVIAARVRREIESGNWAPGTRIPSASEIAAAMRVSQSTATKAVAPLIRDGVLSVHGGRGVFVNPYEPERC